MATLLYHWNFTGDNNINVDDEIYDTESNVVAKVKRRGNYNNSSFSRSEDGILLNNNNSTDAGMFHRDIHVLYQGLNLG